ncbi:MAG TPA: NUDIX hydrolase [Thermoanaerobaculia bacterium]|nr:NUDIX hydrolase [Thermoanaerobaculia bacterium]
MKTTDVTDAQLPRGAGSSTDDVTPVPAASTIVLRGDPFEVLLIRRSENSRFAPGAWVFPGGAVEDDDRASTIAERDETMALRICAVRELFEETGILPGRNAEDLRRFRRELLGRRTKFEDLYPDGWPVFDELVWTARWITPVGVPKRFDTWFFLLSVDEGTVAESENSECVETLWIRPEEALRRERAEKLSLLFPTIKNLEAIATAASSSALLDSRRHAQIRTVKPVLIVEGNRKRIVLPEGEV